MCERCSKILEIIDAAKMRSKSEHRDLLRMGNRWKAAEAEGGYQALRRLQHAIANAN